MLVLTRKKNESIVINNSIKITVVEVRGDKVRLGVEAPRDVDVHRQEVYEQIHGNRLPEEAIADGLPPRREVGSQVTGKRYQRRRQRTLPRMELHKLADKLLAPPLSEEEIDRISYKAADSLVFPEKSP